MDSSVGGVHQIIRTEPQCLVVYFGSQCHCLLSYPDCLIEREYLFGHVIPCLRHFSQTLGLQFHAIDLFSVIPASLSNHTASAGHSNISESNIHINNVLALYELERQGALSLISKEIELCQRVSAGPSFVVSCINKIKLNISLLLFCIDFTGSKVWLQGPVAQHPSRRLHSASSSCGRYISKGTHPEMVQTRHQCKTTGVCSSVQQRVSTI